MRRVLEINEQIPDDELAAGSAALKALARGNATSEQQINAVRFIVDVIAGTDRQDYALARDAQMMAWHNGRRFVGLEIEKMIARYPARTVIERPRRGSGVKSDE